MEFALVLPLLVLLVFAIIDFGRMMNAKITVTEAAREGARATALLDAEAGEQRATAAAADLQPGVEVDIVADCPTDPDPQADAVVAVSYEFRFVTPIDLLAGFAGGGRLTLTSTSIMPCVR